MILEKNQPGKSEGKLLEGMETPKKNRQYFATHYIKFSPTKKNDNLYEKKKKKKHFTKYAANPQQSRTYLPTPNPNQSTGKFTIIRKTNHRFERQSIPLFTTIVEQWIIFFVNVFAKL